MTNDRVENPSRTSDRTTTGSERIARARANLHDLGNWATPAEWAQASNEYVAAVEAEIERLRKSASFYRSCALGGEKIAPETDKAMLP